MLELFGNLLSGLGLFFIGGKFVSEHLKQMTGRKVRQIVSKFTNHPFLAGWWGFVTGALMQSTTAVTFIVTSLRHPDPQP